MNNGHFCSEHLCSCHMCSEPRSQHTTWLFSRRSCTCPKAEAVAPNGLVCPNAGACWPNGDGDVVPKGLEEAPKPAHGTGRAPINRNRPGPSGSDPCSYPCTPWYLLTPSKAKSALSGLTSTIVKAHLPLQSQNSWLRSLRIRGPSVQVQQRSPRACSAAQPCKFITVSSGGALSCRIVS